MFTVAVKRWGEDAFDFSDDWVLGGQAKDFGKVL